MFTFLNHTTAHRTKYGALRNNTASIDATACLDIVHDTLKMNWARIAIPVFDSPPNVTGGRGWTGSSALYDHAYNVNKMQVIPVIRAYPTGIGVVPFVTAANLAQYTTVVGQILDKYPQTKAVIVENEAENPVFYDIPASPTSDYAAMIQAVSSVARPRGIKVYDSGLLRGFPLHIRVSQYILEKYGSTVATQYATDSGMSSKDAQYAQGNYGGLTPQEKTNYDIGCANFDTITGAKAYLDGFNIHYYETPGDGTSTGIALNVVRFDKEYLIALAGKPVICNETGTKGNSQSVLASNMYAEFNRLRFEYVFLWDGDGPASPPAVPFTDVNTGTILPNGVAVRDYTLTH